MKTPKVNFISCRQDLRAEGSQGNDQPAGVTQNPFLYQVISTVNFTQGSALKPNLHEQVFFGKFQFARVNGSAILSLRIPPFIEKIICMCIKRIINFFFFFGQTISLDKCYLLVGLTKQIRFMKSFAYNTPC